MKEGWRAGGATERGDKVAIFKTKESPIPASQFKIHRREMATMIAMPVVVKILKDSVEEG